MSGRASDPGPVLIGGCQRSGTTLVRRMCSRHPRLDVMPETHLMPLLWGSAPAIRRLGRLGLAKWLRRTLPRVNPLWGVADTADRLGALCDRYRDDALQRGDASLSGAPSIFAELLDHWRGVTGARRSGEKTPSHIYYLPALLHELPTAQAIVMHRDPRAAACSEWLKHQTIERPGRRFTWFRFAVRWSSSVDVAQQCANRFGPERVLQLRYEELVEAPDDTARRLCGFLHERFDPSMLEVENQNTSFDLGSEGDSPGVGIDDRSRARWRTTLDPAAVALLERLTRRGMAALGYEHEANGGLHQRLWTGWGVDAMTALARYRPTSFNQLASRNRYPGLRPGEPERHTA